MTHRGRRPRARSSRSSCWPWTAKATLFLSAQKKKQNLKKQILEKGDFFRYWYLFSISFIITEARLPLKNRAFSRKPEYQSRGKRSYTKRSVLIRESNRREMEIHACARERTSMNNMGMWFFFLVVYIKFPPKLLDLENANLDLIVLMGEETNFNLGDVLMLLGEAEHRNRHIIYRGMERERKRWKKQIGREEDGH